MSRTCLAVLILGNLIVGSFCQGAESPTGEQIYKQLCASCHGASGEGDNKHYPQPLTGDRSVLELAEYIDKTMPEKNYRVNSKICKTCPVKDICFAGDSGVVKIKSLEPLDENQTL